MTMTVEQMFEMLLKRQEERDRKAEERFKKAEERLKKNKERYAALLAQLRDINKVDEYFEEEFSSSNTIILQTRGKLLIADVSIINDLSDTPNEVIEHGESNEEEEIFHVIEDELFSSDLTIVQPRCKTYIADGSTFNSPLAATESCTESDESDDDEVLLRECDTHDNEVIFREAVSTIEEHIVNRVYVCKSTFCKRTQLNGKYFSFLIFGALTLVMLTKGAFLGDAYFKAKYAHEVFDPGIGRHEISKLQLQHRRNSGYGPWYRIGNIHKKKGYPRLKEGKAIDAYEFRDSLSSGLMGDFVKRLLEVELTEVLLRRMLTGITEDVLIDGYHQQDQFAFVEELKDPTFVNRYSRSLPRTANAGGFCGNYAILPRLPIQMGLLTGATFVMVVYTLIIFVLSYGFDSFHGFLSDLGVPTQKYFHGVPNEINFTLLEFMDGEVPNTSITSKCSRMVRLSSVT